MKKTLKKIIKKITSKKPPKLVLKYAMVKKLDVLCDEGLKQFKVRYPKGVDLLDRDVYIDLAGNNEELHCAAQILKKLFPSRLATAQVQAEKVIQAAHLLNSIAWDGTLFPGATRDAHSEVRQQCSQVFLGYAVTALRANPPKKITYKETK